MGTILIIFGAVLVITGIAAEVILHFHPLKYKSKKNSEAVTKDEYIVHGENARTTAAEAEHRHKTVKMNRNNKRKTSLLNNRGEKK